MQAWLGECAPTYLARLFRLETLHQNEACVDCNGEHAVYCCQDCLSQPQLCRTCIVSQHRRFPTHRWKQWVGTHFKTVSPADLEYVYHLGHGGHKCDLGENKVMNIGDINGFHQLNVRFCRHPGHSDRAGQLMESHIFPCSDKNPSSGFTFSLLRFIYLLEVEGKLPMQKIYNILVQRTNPLFPHRVRDRYRELSRVSRQWTFLQHIRRSGSSLDLDNSNHADLAISCPSCPNPEINYKLSDVTPDDQ